MADTQAAPGSALVTRTPAVAPSVVDVDTMWEVVLSPNPVTALSSGAVKSSVKNVWSRRRPTRVNKNNTYIEV